MSERHPLQCFEPGCTSLVKVVDGYRNEDHPTLCDPCWLRSKASWNPKDCWQTPPWLLDLVDEFYGRGQWFDPCPSNPTFDGLACRWPSKTYINPPFSEYKKWAEYGRLQPLEQIWICHHDSSTERFQLLLPGATVCLLYDRVSFIHPETGLPKGTDIAKSQTLIYRGNFAPRFAQVFSKVGFVAEQFPVGLLREVRHQVV